MHIPVTNNNIVRMFHRILELVRRRNTYQVDLLQQWKASINDKLTVGIGTRIQNASLAVREPEGCSLSIGSESNIECSFVLERRDVNITVGSRTHIGGGTLIDAACQIAVGDDVLIAFDVLIMDHDSHSLCFSERKTDVNDWVRGYKDWTRVERRPVRIESKAWIGTRAIILKGLTVGEGAIVGAGSVVTKDVPSWTVVAGNPARVIRELANEEVQSS